MRLTWLQFTGTGPYIFSRNHLKIATAVDYLLSIYSTCITARRYTGKSNLVDDEPAVGMDEIIQRSTAGQLIYGLQ